MFIVHKTHIEESGVIKLITVHQSKVALLI